MDTGSSLPPSSSPSSEFVLNTNPFSNWDHRINARWWFYDTYKVCPHSVEDKREYRADLLNHFVADGAKVVECDVVIPVEGGLVEDGDTISDGAFGLELSSTANAANSSYSVWYRDCYVTFSVGDSVLINLTIYHRPGSRPPFLTEIGSYLRVREGSRVSILLENHGGLYAKSVDFPPPRIDDLELNYGTGFAGTHRQIVEKLERRQPGLLTFSGHPGTGKSYYIKWLTSVVNRSFIFIPVAMVGQLSSPGFLKLLMQHPESVLVLEDAEQAVQSREIDFYNSSTVSTLLNLADGILGSILNITVLVTLNADRSSIDKALLRKGRLLFDYDFKKLSVEDSRRLAAHLQRDIRVDEPTSLADIYNASEITGYQEVVKPKIGFGFTRT